MSLRNAIALTTGSTLKDTHKTALRRVNTADLEMFGVNVGRLGFLIDRTGSRQATWSSSRQLQSGLFDRVKGMGNLETRLIHFGGSQVEDCGWTGDPGVTGQKMNEIECEGGNTQIVKGLRKFANLAEGSKANAVVLVGDCFEEDLEDLIAVARDLKAMGIRVFAFHDDSADYGLSHKFLNDKDEYAFRKVAEITGGAFMKLHEDMPLNELCDAVAISVVGGDSALERLAASSKAADALQQQLKLGYNR